MRSAVLPWQSVSLVLTLALVAEMPAAQVNQTSEKQPAPCVVSGQVVTAADGAPIRLARVALVQENVRSHPAVFAATTDNEGRFEIKKVAPGRYRFFASRPGFLHQEYQAKGTSDGAVLTLSPGQEFVDVLYRLALAAVITGRVVDESGEPMDGVMVTALRKVTAEEKEDWGPRTTKVQMTAVSSAVTDDRGEYRIFGLKPGEYYLKAGTDMENSGIVQEFDYLE
jgi:5-hydroxyisourate hydrolase-like protein (transthyretin family)